MKNYAEANGIAMPEGGLFIAHGIAIPVLIAIGVGMVMTFITTRTRFGRYVFAIGGNPEAAEPRRHQHALGDHEDLLLMGLLVAIAAAISTARLNAATNALGTLDELLTIAAAVIGGTSLAGGVGHDCRRHAGRAADAVAAVGHGASGHRHAAAKHRRRRWCLSLPSGSTPSTANASEGGGPWQTIARR